MRKLFEIENVSCSYDKQYTPGVSRIVLDIRHLVLPAGKTVFVVGESGIGKSTVLEVLGIMNNTIVPSRDSVFRFYEDEGKAVDILKLWRENNDAALSGFRRKHFNFIFQSTNLMKNFTAYENISIVRMLQGYSREESFERASGVLHELGLDHVGQDRMSQELSGGQQQRLAFARAVIPDFTVLFGDEPTGNLDGDNAVKAMSLLSDKLKHTGGSSAIIVSHDMHLAVSFADIIVRIRKEFCNISDHGDESEFKGVIDDDCIFTPDSDRQVWTGNSRSFSLDEFEQFLKQRQ